ncbi:MAG: hypothetical protein AAGF73_11305 [Actinomycetota bacterium]
MNRPTPSTISRLVRGLVAACTAVAIVGSSSATATGEDGSAGTNPLRLDLCWTDNPLGDGYRVTATTVNNTSVNALFRVDELIPGNPQGDQLHDETLQPGQTGTFSHVVPLDKHREYIYYGTGFARQVTNFDYPAYVDHCFS